MAILYGNSDNFKDLTAGEFTVVDFFSTTCGPCRAFSRILEDLEAEIPFLNIVKVNISENPELSQEFDVVAVPTIHFYKDGRLVDSHLGVMQAEDVKEVISRYMFD